jgi:rhomboid protease GluP
MSYIDTLYKKIMYKKKYLQYIGDSTVGYERLLLIKRKLGSIRLIELIDAETITREEQLIESFENSKELFEEMYIAEKQYIVKVFVFKEQPNDKFKQIIKNGQTNVSIKGQYVKCISLVLKDEEIIKHYSSIHGFFGLKDILTNNFKDNLDSLSDEEIETIIENRGKGIIGKHKHREAKVTYILLGINIIVWILMMITHFKTGQSINEILYFVGSRDYGKIASGEYSRLVKAMFLHLDSTHIVLNAYLLYALGPIVEKVFGGIKYLGIYLLAGIVGNIIGFAFSPLSGVGASGAIYGLLGAILYIAIEKPQLYKTCFGKNAFLGIALALGAGFIIPGVDNYQHFGGVLGGFLGAGIFKINIEKRWYLKSISFIVALSIISYTGMIYGFSSESSQAAGELQNFRRAIKSNDITLAENIGREILEKREVGLEEKHLILEVLINIELMQKNYDNAMKDVDRLIEIQPKIGHYYAGKIFYYQNKFSDSTIELTKAIEYSKLENDEELTKSVLAILNQIKETEKS